MMLLDVDGDRLLIRAESGREGVEVAGIVESINGYDYRLGYEGRDAVLHILLKTRQDPITLESASSALAEMLQQINDAGFDVFLADTLIFGVPTKISNGKALMVSERQPDT